MSKDGWRGLRKRTPSINAPSSKSSLRTVGMLLSFAVAQINASQYEKERRCRPRIASRTIATVRSNTFQVRT